MRKHSTFQQRAALLGIILGLLWGIEALDWLLGGRLDFYGVRPRELGGLPGIIFAPFLHRDWEHLAANSLPLLFLGWLIMLRGPGDFLEATVMIVLLGGLGTWLIGKTHSVHIGASGVIFGYFSFLILCGIIEFSLSSVLSALLVGFLYGGLIWGVLPSQPLVSWEAHLCGLLAGLVTAWRLDRPARRYRYRG